VHEMSLIESVVALVEDERRKQGFSRVRVVRLRVGALACVEPDALRFCFEAVSWGAVAEGARLEIDSVPGQGWCDPCDRSVPLGERYGGCPICGSGYVRVIAGDDLRLVELEVE